MRPAELVELFRRPAATGTRADRKLAKHLTIGDLRRGARRRLPRSIFQFLEGGAEDELSLRHNRLALDRRALVPRVLSGIASIDLSRTVLGVRRDLPFALAPTGFSQLVHHDGELAVARAATDFGIPYTVSAVGANTSLADLDRSGPGCRWFNLYPMRDQGINRDLIARARHYGYEALVLTVDVPVAGGREQDVRNGLTVPPHIGLRTAVDGLRHPGWSWRFIRGDMVRTANVALGDTAASSTALPALYNAALSWDDLATFRELWGGPMILKGVMSVSDALRASEAGVQGIVVSNHGGRQLDGVEGTIDALERICAEVGDTMDVLVDSGFRRGRDIVVALALGARAVLLGRAYLYGLAVAGENGVTHALTILRAELERSMHLLGVGSVDSLDPALVRTLCPVGQ